MSELPSVHSQFHEVWSPAPECCVKVAEACAQRSAMVCVFGVELGEVCSVDVSDFAVSPLCSSCNSEYESLVACVHSACGCAVCTLGTANPPPRSGRMGRQWRPMQPPSGLVRWFASLGLANRRAGFVRVCQHEPHGGNNRLPVLPRVRHSNGHTTRPGRDAAATTACARSLPLRFGINLFSGVV